MDSPTRNQRRCGRRHQRGQSLLEFATVLPLMLLVVTGVIEFGRAFYYYNTLNKAVREGARYMCSKPYNTTEQGNAKNMVVYGNAGGTGSSVLPGLTVNNIQIVPRNRGTTESTPPEWVRVQVTGYRFNTMVPGLVPLTNVLMTPGVEMRYVGLNSAY